MKLTLDWLKEFVSIPWSQEELAHRLSMAGLEVEGEEINVTPNRGDCLSILGLAREISALKNEPLKYKKTIAPKGEKPIKESLQVKVLDRKGCPRYMARSIFGVTIKPSPAWLKERLESAGIRSINNVVDCTNYVMLELGHPLHAFDARFLRGGQIVVRTEKEKTQFKTLDGETRRCEPADLFICDGEGPVALAGIMGGQNSEVREDTKDIVLEAAFFNPQRIHAAAKRLGLASESSYRFERGVDPNGVENALHRVCALIVETAGGVPTKDWIDCYPQKARPLGIVLETKEVERILGVALPAKKIKKLLESLGFRAEGSGKKLTVFVPTHRFDISRPVDLIEEAARSFGYDHIPATLPKIRAGITIKPKESDSYTQTVDVLVGLGFTESCHLSFISEKEAKIFAPDPKKIVFLANPLSEDQNVLRPSLTPSLLKALSYNLNRQVKEAKIFELGTVFSWEGEKVLEKKNLSLIDTDFYSLKGVLDLLIGSLQGISKNQGCHSEPQAKNLMKSMTSYVAAELPGFLAPNAAATLRLDGKKIGWLGGVHPDILAGWEIGSPIFAAELDWELLALKSQQTPVQYRPLPKFPFVERDIALVVDQALPAKKIEEEVWEANTQGLIQKVSFFDLYKGEGLPPGKKSLAYRIRYASPERTLTNEEVTQAHEALVAHLEKTLPAKLR